MRGRLWRRSDPRLSLDDRARLVAELMRARRAVRTGEPDARARVHAAKVALGERGPVWWDDGAPDLTRHLARTTLYAEWWAHNENPGPPPGEPGPRVPSTGGPAPTPV